MVWFALAVLAALYVVLAAWATRGVPGAAASEYAALHDHVTELPNRVLFCDRVDQAIKIATRDAAQVAVLMIDLDRFRDHDTLGHHNGDLLLCRRRAADGPRAATPSRVSAGTSSRS